MQYRRKGGFRGVFGLLAIVLLAAAGQSSAATCSTAFCGLDLNSTNWINNNTWGSDSSPAGWWETVTTNSGTAWRTDFSWPSGPNNNGVKAYPSAVLGWHWGWRLQNTGLPVQLSAERNVNTNYAYTVTFNGGTGNVAYDIWLHTQSNPLYENPSDEIMIWVNNTNAGPISQQPIISNISIGGSTWNLHRGNIGWNVWSFVRTSNSSSGSFNIKNFTDYLRANQGMSSAKYLTSVQFGTEVFWGTGNLNVTNFSASVGAAGGGGSGPVANGTYRIVARHSGKALDVNGHGTADGTNVLQWAYGGGNNQRWTLTHLGSGVYSIIGVESGKALEVASASTANGTNVDIRTYTAASNQRWTITTTSGGYYRLTPVSSSGSALDVSGNSTANGANVHQWSWTGANNQQWIFQAP